MHARPACFQAQLYLWGTPSCATRSSPRFCSRWLSVFSIPAWPNPRPTSPSRPPHTPALGEPRAIATADFNVDGAPDFATANLRLGEPAQDGVAVFYNNGDGTFAAPTPIPTGAGAFDLVAADMNRDARPDLIVANADASHVSILLGSPAGLVETFIWNTSASPRSIAVGDFTRDGRPDLAVAEFDNHTVLIGQGNGDGTVTTLNAFGVGLNPEDIVTGDFNRDGTLDLYVTNVTSQTASIFSAPRAAGSLCGITSPMERGHVIPTWRTSIRDGRLDSVLVGDSKFRIELGLPASSSVYGADVGADSRGVVAFDVNSDSWPDAAVANRGEHGVQILVNASAGPEPIAFLPPVRLATGAGARALAAADVDGDGRTDLVVANQYAGTVTVMRNQTRRFPPSTSIR